MSLADKINGWMVRPGEDPNAKDDVPWWMKYAGRGLGTIGSVAAMFFGLLNCPSILFGGIFCFLSGVWQILAGFIVICCEAPCCCMFVEHVQKLSEWIESKPYFYKAAAYCALAIPPIILCPGVSSILGSGCIFGTGIIYGMMGLGRKASAEEMRAAAAADTTSSVPPLFKPPVTSSMRANLVANAQPVGFTGSPFDNPV